MSEFGGEDGPHGIDPRNPSAVLSAAEKLRLLYATASSDPRAPRDPKKHAWRGTRASRYEGLDGESG
jgi:hypothetical protein